MSNKLLIEVFQDLFESNNISEAYDKYQYHLKNKNDELKNIVFVVGVDNYNSDFYISNIQSFINTNQNNKAFVVTPFPQYNNINVFCSEYFESIPIDSTLLVDSNAINYFYYFYVQNIELDKKEEEKYRAFENNELIESIFKNDIDINYLPYAFEDFLNPFRINKNIEYTKRKIKAVMFLTNIDREFYKLTKQFRINTYLLNQEGFDNFDDFYASRIKYLETIKDTQQTIFADYFLFTGFLIAIYNVNKQEIKNIEKMKIILEMMHSTGRLLSGLIYFASKYFNEDKDAKTFLELNTKKNSIEQFRNKGWDIFLFHTGVRFTSNSNQNVLFGYPMFLTQDKIFFNGYLKNILNIGLIIDKNEKNEFPISTACDLNNEESDLLNLFYSSNNIGLRKAYIKNNQDQMYELMQSFYDEQLEKFENLQ